MIRVDKKALPCFIGPLRVPDAETVKNSCEQVPSNFATFIITLTGNRTSQREKVPAG